MLKPNFHRRSPLLPPVTEDRNVLALSSSEVGDKARAVDMPSGVDLVTTRADLPDAEDDDVTCPSSAVVKGQQEVAVWP